MKNVVITVVLVLAAEVLAAVLLAKAGAFGVAATSNNPAFLDWLLVTDRDAVTEGHARGITVPSLDDEAMVRRGLEHYDGMCVGCHGAPGVAPAPPGKGLNPRPPALAKMGTMSTADEAEAFWIIKHGIRMTGMPAFGPTHRDDQIWDMVAFLARLQHLNPEQYRTLVEEQRAEEGSQTSGQGSAQAQP
jgi:mono/diheme cytochrome c family protein